MAFIYILVGIMIAVSARSAWNIARILRSNRKARTERDRLTQERTDDDIDNQSAER